MSADAWLVRRAPVLCRVIAVLAALLVTAPFVYHLWRGSIAYLGLFEDDYFYYALIADKLATAGKLTYDGVTITNGFHPAWFLTVFVLRLAAGGLNGVFYTLLTVAFFASCVATYELLRALARSLGASPPLAAALPLVFAVANDAVIASGMETALDVPLLVWLVLELSRSAQVTPRRAAWLGFVSSLAILARLDIALVVAIVTVGWLYFARPSLAQLGRVALPFCAAGAALPLYALANLLVCHSIIPVSAAAKRLVAHRGISLSYLRFVAFHTAYGWSAGMLLVLGTAAAWLLWRGRGKSPALAKPEALFAGATVIAFAGVFFAMNSLSGWTYFGWYAYPFAASLVPAMVLVGTVVAAHLSERQRAGASALVVATACVLAVTQGVSSFATRGPRWSTEDNGMLAMSIDLARHMEGRDGVIAMGAMSGFVANTLKRPIVQLEGLVADRAMVDHIRREDDLGDVLREYHVDYVVVSLHDTTMIPHDGCYTMTEPNPEWSGPRVHRMSVDLCGEPIAHFLTNPPERSWSVLSKIDTYVFDVRAARFRKPVL